MCFFSCAMIASAQQRETGKEKWLWLVAQPERGYGRGKLTSFYFGYNSITPLSRSWNLGNVTNNGATALVVRFRHVFALSLHKNAGLYVFCGCCGLDCPEVFHWMGTKTTYITQCFVMFGWTQ